MSRRRRKQSEIFYTELRIAANIPLLWYPDIREKMIKGLSWCCEKRGLRIYEYSVLPDRILLMANTAWGNFSDIIQDFANFSSKSSMLLLRHGKLNGNTAWMIPALQEFGSTGKPEGIHIWEEEIQMESLFKTMDIDAKSEFIKNRAVQVGITERPEHYTFCSANPKHPLEGWIVEATDPWS